MSFPYYISGKPGWEKLTTTAKKHKLGTPMFIYPNRWFCYALAGEALLAGQLVEGVAAVAALSEDLVPVTAGAIGDTTIVIQLATTPVVIDEFADGFMIFPAVEELGHQYLIKSHPAGVSTASLSIVIDEEAGLVKAITTSQEVGLVHNPFAKCLLWNTTKLGFPVGVAPVDIANTEFGWLQIKGPAIVLMDATAPSKGEPIGGSILTQGSVGVALLSSTTTVTADVTPLGIMGATDGVSAEFHQVQLNIGML